jgi:hypothetical protein
MNGRSRGALPVSFSLSSFGEKPVAVTEQTWTKGNDGTLLPSWELTTGTRHLRWSVNVFSKIIHKIIHRLEGVSGCGLGID